MLCSYTRPRYQVYQESVYKTIGPLVSYVLRKNAACPTFTRVAPVFVGGGPTIKKQTRLYSHGFFRRGLKFRAKDR